MLREQKNIVDAVHRVFEVILMILVWWTAHDWLNTSLIEGRLIPFYEYDNSVLTFVLLASGYFFVTGFNVYYRPVTALVLAREVFIACLCGFLGMTFVMYLGRLPHISRIYVAASTVTCSLGLFGWNLCLLVFYSTIRARGVASRRLLLVGNGHNVPPILKVLHDNPGLGLISVGWLDLEEADAPGEPFAGGHLGPISNISKVLNEKVIDTVLFAVYRQDPQVLEQAMLTCYERGIDVWVKPDLFSGTRLAQVDYLQNMPLLVFCLGPPFSFFIILKRLIDILGSLVFLVLCAFPLAAICVVIRWTSRGPAVFKQERVGLNGRKFVMYKLRTMVADAQENREKYSLQNEMDGPVFKMENDPRITPMGRFLRKYSLDELPQLWNVLKGDMSLVGPRPPLSEEVEKYRGWQRRRLSMRPGLTCLWQVTLRNRVSDFEEWVRLDLEYIDNWNLFLDLKIALLTLPAVLRGTGM